MGRKALVLVQQVAKLDQAGEANVRPNVLVPPATVYRNASDPEPAIEAAGPELELVAVEPEIRKSIEVLVVDDEHSLRESCASLLRTEGFSVSVCGRGDDATRLVRNRRFDVILLDLYMSQVSGLDLMAAALDAHPDTLIIVMTGNPSVESSVKALRAGAWDYLPKPFSAMHFEILMGRAAHAVVVGRESSRREKVLTSAASFSDRVRLYGKSAALRKVIDLANKVARTDASVFITGESGTGKEVIAQYIHLHSRRSSRARLVVACSSKDRASCARAAEMASRKAISASSASGF